MQPLTLGLKTLLAVPLRRLFLHPRCSFSPRGPRALTSRCLSPTPPALLMKFGPWEDQVGASMFKKIVKLQVLFFPSLKPHRLLSRVVFLICNTVKTWGKKKKHYVTSGISQKICFSNPKMIKRNVLYIEIFFSLQGTDFQI